MSLSCWQCKSGIFFALASAEHGQVSAVHVLILYLVIGLLLASPDRSNLDKGQVTACPSSLPALAHALHLQSSQHYLCGMKYWSSHRGKEAPVVAGTLTRGWAPFLWRQDSFAWSQLLVKSVAGHHRMSMSCEWPRLLHPPSVNCLMRSGLDKSHQGNAIAFNSEQSATRRLPSLPAGLCKACARLVQGWLSGGWCLLLWKPWWYSASQLFPYSRLIAESWNSFHSPTPESLSHPCLASHGTGRVCV